ncbi:MAG: hypothetical protein QOD44_1118, partial [Solirubrobacteraceae bacterium]|nr:hypothetical protein [Solirubrobacteraceae bacterium]
GAPPRRSPADSRGVIRRAPAERDLAERDAADGNEAFTLLRVRGRRGEAQAPAVPAQAAHAATVRQEALF